MGKILITILLTSILLISCASFDTSQKNVKPLNYDNLFELNGTYSIVSTKFDSIYENRQIWMYNNILTELDRKQLKDTLKIDSLKNYKISLNILDRNNIKISYIEENEIIRERKIKAKLKRDGYLYLRNKNVQPILIPYIAGAIDIKKSRLGLSENNNLIFDVVNHRSGAILIIGFLDGRTRKYRLEFQREK